MRSYIYYCESCGQLFNSPLEDDHAVPHLNVKELNVTFSFRGSSVPIGAQGPNRNYGTAKWLTKQTKVNNADVGQRHFCSGKCIGTWIDRQIKGDVGGTAIARQLVEKFTFAPNGYQPEDFNLSRERAILDDTQTVRPENGDDF